MVLAAGRGERMRPWTDSTPKALLPVGGAPLLEHAIARIRPFVDDVAVNAHWLHEQIEAHLAGTRIHVSVEQPEALGTAGALGALREWIAGREVVVTNADAWFDPPPAPPLGGDDRIRLLGVPQEGPSDFGTYRYAGVARMPWSAVRDLEAEPSGLYEVCWARAWEQGSLDLVPYDGTFIDCGTPDDWRAAARQAGDG